MLQAFCCVAESMNGSSSLLFAKALEQDNCWIRLSERVGWQKLEHANAKTFFHTGRADHSGHMVLGAPVVKHKL